MHASDATRGLLSDLSAGKARYVTACQQLLALAAVGAALLPATGVVNLDVVQEPRPARTVDVPLHSPGSPTGGHPLGVGDLVEPLPTPAHHQHQ